MKLSIVIVHYQAKRELFGCLKSIKKSQPDFPSEIIVVDNDEEKTIEMELQEKFPEVKYMKSPRNIGFGAGNNLGAKSATGEFLFFLNPDTQIFKDTPKILINFLIENEKVGIAAPLLLDENKKPYPLQGTRELTPLTALFALSFLNELFPQNPISKNYWLLDWGKMHAREVAVVPGTAFLIRRQLFEKIGGFDESFFLFFEETDLCRRVKKLGWQIFINPQAKVIHLWGRSTPKTKKTKNIFRQSRFYYFRKHWGISPAIIVESLLRSGEWIAEKI